MNNINWQYVDSKEVKVDEYNDIVARLRAKGLRRIDTGRKAVVTGLRYLKNCYFTSNPKNEGSARNQLMLYVADDNEGFSRYFIQMGHSQYSKDYELYEGGDEKNYGYYGWKFINQQFKREFGITLENAYSGSQFKDLCWELRECVPSPINFVVQEQQLQGIKLQHCYKADESSSYPAKLAKALPTLHGYRRIEGRVEPDEEYPFAFYLKSHHLAIFNELDSREFDSKFYMSWNDAKSRWKHYQDIDDKDEVTILCKKCEYDFEPLIQKIYKGRKEHPEYKAYMNMCIGYFYTTQPTVGPMCAHLAAVVLARCIKTMSDRAKILESEGNKVILINTDAIAWIGQDSSLAVNEKSLGAFVSEHRDCEMIVCGVKKYQIFDKGHLTTVCAGFPTEKAKRLEFGDIARDDIEIEFYVLDKDGFLVKRLKKF